MPRPRILYKYYPPERIDVLERRMIYFSHPSIFNDPFELEPYFRLSVSAKRFLKSPYANAPTRSNPVTAYFRLAGLPDAQRRNLEERHRHTLVFSMSAEDKNLLLWAHYAASHTGFAIGFNSNSPGLTARSDGGSRRLQPVNYTQVRPSAAIWDEAKEQKMLLTKSTHWAYEREWRMFESATNSDEKEAVVKGVWGFHFHPSTVDRVLLGCRADGKMEEQVERVLAQEDFEHVRLIRLDLDERRYRLTGSAC